MIQPKTWEDLVAAIEEGTVPSTCIVSKATAESFFKEHHFALLAAYQIELKLNDFVPYEQVFFLSSQWMPA